MIPELSKDTKKTPWIPQTFSNWNPKKEVTQVYSVDGYNFLINLYNYIIYTTKYHFGSSSILL